MRLAAQSVDGPWMARAATNTLLNEGGWVSRMKMSSAQRAVEVVRSGATVGILGCGGGILEPDLLIAALGERHRRTGSPKGITLFHTAGLGDRQGRGTEPLASAYLIDRIIAGHYGMCPPVGDLVASGSVQGYNLPQGVLNVLLREAAGGRSSLTTKIGLDTFVDPRNGGGRLNDQTTDDLVTLVREDSKEQLRYAAVPIDVAFIRGSVADEAGNLSLADETAYLEAYDLAAAARGSGGVVVTQVRSVVPRGSLPAKEVHVPSTLVDIIVEHPGQWQTYEAPDNPAFSGRERLSLRSAPMPFDQRKVIARRAARELHPGATINLGVGVPDGVAAVIAEEGLASEVTVTLEQGLIGGVTSRGVMFGATVNHDAVISMPAMFDFYHGGGLDIAYLGFAQVDRHGNVNVSKYGGQLVGCGGFIDISQPTSTVVFCGTFTAAGTHLTYVDGTTAIVREGAVPKFVPDVDQVTFSAARARADGHRVLYVTERATFELTDAGPTLIELAPGMDIERDILPVCGFEPAVASDLRVYEQSVTLDRPLALGAEWERSA